MIEFPEILKVKDLNFNEEEKITNHEETERRERIARKQMLKKSKKIIEKKKFKKPPKRKGNDHDNGVHINKRFKYQSAFDMFNHDKPFNKNNEIDKNDFRMDIRPISKSNNNFVKGLQFADKEAYKRFVYVIVNSFNKMVDFGFYDEEDKLRRKKRRK